VRSSHVYTVAALAALIASLGVVGSDALWLVPLGAKVARGHLPGSIAYATAPTGGWHDVPVLGQLVLWALYHLFGGVRGLVVAQVIGAVVAFGALARGLRRETSGAGVLVVSAIVLAGSLGAVVVIAAGVFSLGLFSVLLALLQADARSPGRRIWWSVPLLALWGNLHGGVLAGLGLLACYLIFARARRSPALACGVLGAGALALAANPVLWRTPRYYSGVLHSEVARGGEGLWVPLGLDTPDIILLLAALTLVVVGLTQVNRLRLWEAMAIIWLAAGTVHVARTGVFLVFVLAYPAARALRLGTSRSPLFAGTTAILVAVAVLSMLRGPVAVGSEHLARVAARTGEPVLAEAIPGQQVVLHGGRVWVDNPIDAFRRSDQRLYLDWLEGRPAGDRAVEHARYVLVLGTSSAGLRAARNSWLTRLAEQNGFVLYRVRRTR
jgi:hypothetical protein